MLISAVKAIVGRSSLVKQPKLAGRVADVAIRMQRCIIRDLIFVEINEAVFMKVNAKIENDSD